MGHDLAEEGLLGDLKYLQPKHFIADILGVVEGAFRAELGPVEVILKPAEVGAERPTLDVSVHRVDSFNAHFGVKV